MVKPLTFLITSGPTREYIDPVRFLSNASSGRMGAALAAAAKEKKHRVVFICGPSEIPPPAGIERVPVVSAREMLAAVKTNLRKADIVIGAAAVADYRPLKTMKHKIKKSDALLTLPLTPNPDILSYVGKHKGRRVLAGFALESRDLLAAARKKMLKKNMDCIVANTPAAIGRKNSTAWLMTADGNSVEMRNGDKKRLAEKIIDETIRIWENRKTR